MDLFDSQKNLVSYRYHLNELVTAADSKLLENYPIEAYIKQLDTIERQHAYNFVPPGIQIQCEEIWTKYGVRALGLYHKLLLVSLIEKFDERKNRYRIPVSIQSLILGEYDRIILALKNTEEGFYVHSNDMFAKDLGLCRMKLIPCGSEVVDLYSGIPRRTLFLGNTYQFLRATIYIMMRVRGFKPLYESHWDRRLVRYFTKEEYDLCYKRIAELLKMNPGVKGVAGSSWWYDPQLKKIAPELVFLRKIPEQNGAQVFRVGVNSSAIKDATTFSKNRKTLYQEGRYTPCIYMLVWARDDILRWAGNINPIEVAHDQ